MMKEKLNFKKLKKDQLLILLLLGVLLIIIALPTGDKTSEEPEPEAAAEVQPEEITSTETYEAVLEQRLSDALSKVAGVGKVEVMITTKSSSEVVVEKDITSSSSTTKEADSDGGSRDIMDTSADEETVYIQDGSGNNVPYVIKELRPEVEGVVVIAEGGDNSVTAANITDAVMALFQVEAHKIKVMKMNS